jgi:putative copper resistance protein D
MTTSLLILARMFYFGSGMVLVGVVAFRWLFLLPAFAGEAEEAWQKFAPLFSRLNRMFIGSAIVLVISGLALFWAVAAGMSDSSLTGSLTGETLGTVFFQTQFGAVFQWRAGVAALMAILIGWLAQTGWQARRICSPLEIVAGIIAVALMASFAWTGHAAASAGPDFVLRIAADATHLMVAAIWPMGLLPFAMFLGRARGIAGGAVFGPTLRLIGRFSNVSLGVVCVLIGTGLTNSYFIVGHIQALFTTTYGQVLGVKLLLFAGMLGIAAYNRFRIVPVLFAQPAGVGATGPLLRQLQRLVMVELGLAVAVIAVVSVLGTTPPPQ